MSLLPKMNEMKINLKVDEGRGGLYGTETRVGISGRHSYRSLASLQYLQAED